MKYYNKKKILIYIYYENLKYYKSRYKKKYIV